MILFLIILQLISIGLSIMILMQKIQFKNIMKQPRAGTEYHNCEYCHRYLPEVIQIDKHYVCTSQICRNHIGATH